MFKLFLLIISTVIIAVVASDICNTTCRPFRLLVIWHTSNGEDHAFIEQKRLIMQLLLDIPQGTEIHVTALNTQLTHLLHFKKNKAMDWIYNISMYNPEILQNHTIKSSLINETVFSFREQNDKKEVTELTVLVVSEQTLTENRLETIKNIKSCVVFTGLNPPPPFWTSLATDRQHVVMLNMTSENIEENISGTANTVFDVLCRDSRFICDTDEFWTGKRCVNCSYICSANTKELQDACLDLCPYYSQLFLENADNEADKNVTVECDNEADKNGPKRQDKEHTIFILISLLLTFLTTVAVGAVAVCTLLRRFRMLKQHSTAYLKRKHLNQETSRTPDKYELKAQQETIHLNS